MCDITHEKNHTLQEMSRTMLNERFIPQKYWSHAVETATYIFNRVLNRKTINKTPYKMLRGKKPSLEFFKVFGCRCLYLTH